MQKSCCDKEIKAKLPYQRPLGRRLRPEEKCIGWGFTMNRRASNSNKSKPWSDSQKSYPRM
jgi:hypothetical protein